MMPARIFLKMGDGCKKTMSYKAIYVNIKFGDKKFWADDDYRYVVENITRPEENGLRLMVTCRGREMTMSDLSTFTNINDHTSKYGIESSDGSALDVYLS